MPTQASTERTQLDRARLKAWLDSRAAEAREFFSLSEAELRAKSLDEATVAMLAGALAESERRREAAELLAASGAEVEALRNAGAAFLALDAVVEPDVLADARAPLRAACAEGAKEPGEGLLAELLALQGTLADRVWPLTVDAERRAATRFDRRLHLASMVVLVGFLLGWWWQHTAVTAKASSSWGGRYLPANVLDDDEASHWVLPDHGTGWIELRFRSTRSVREVRLLNGYEPSTYGVVDFRLEASLDGHVVKAVDGSFAGQPRSGKQAWLIVPFVTNARVDAIRVVVKTSRELGASLAEIQVD